jgi:hypothetical protein
MAPDRSVAIQLQNNSGFTLNQIHEGEAHGDYTGGQGPPGSIPNGQQANWEGKNKDGSVMTGTQGFVVYEIEVTGYSKVNPSQMNPKEYLYIYWDNPWAADPTGGPGTSFSAMTSPVDPPLNDDGTLQISGGLQGPFGGSGSSSGSSFATPPIPSMFEVKKSGGGTGHDIGASGGGPQAPTIPCGEALLQVIGSAALGTPVLMFLTWGAQQKIIQNAYAYVEVDLLRNPASLKERCAYLGIDPTQEFLKSQWTSMKTILLLP